MGPSFRQDGSTGDQARAAGFEFRLAILLGNQPSQDRDWIKAEKSGDLHKLADINPPLAPFVIADEGLRAAELLRESGLSEALGPARFGQEAAELIVDGVAPHGARLWIAAAYTKF